MEAIAHPEEVLEEALFEAKRVLVGQDRMIERLFVCWLARGHCLLEGAPGLAKTLAAETVARILGGSFARLQFTPDLVPADLVGTRIYRPSQEAFDVELGPVFANVVLADEINRAPAKVQSALLEVMAERHVSIGGVDVPGARAVPRARDAEPDRERGRVPAARGAARPVPDEGLVDYPSGARGGRDRPAHERRPAAGAAGARRPTSMQSLQRAADEVFVHDAVLDYAVRLVLATGEPEAHGLDDIKGFIAHGASPRATLGLVAAGRALALLRGRNYVMPQDVYDVARDVLRHRVLLSYEALADGVTAEDVVDADRLRRSARPASPRRRTRPSSSGHRRRCRVVTQRRDRPEREHGSGSSSSSSTASSTACCTATTRATCAVRAARPATAGSTSRATTSAASTGT